jgi:photosystem II stability/assembly factor-like uncharacterized protein
MKSYAVIIILGILLATLAHAQTFWRLLPVPTSRDLNKVCFLDSLNGWLAGDSGTIIKTTNGGQSWSTQNSGTTADIVDLFMLNTNRGWAVAYSIAYDSAGAYVLQTSDGGAHWRCEPYADRSKFFLSMYFLDSLNGWMAGASGDMVRTTDGGTEWVPAAIDPDSPHLYWNLARVKFVSSQRGFAVGGRFDMCGVLWRSTNGGSSWVNSSLGPEPLCDLAFSDSANGIGVGGDYEFGASMIRTTDGGGTWGFQWLGVFGQAKAISFRTATEAWSPLGFAGASMYTTNGGDSWTSVSSPAPIHQAMNDVQFTDRKTGYMAGDSGIVLKYNYWTSSVNVGARWNLISLPMMTTNRVKSNLFPTSISDAYAFTNHGYERTDTLVPGNGYWLKFPSPQVVTLEGFPCAADTIIVRQGWNMIGSISQAVACTTISTIPSGLITGEFFAFKGGYIAADTIEPGRGYWVKLTQPGSLILSAPSSNFAKTADAHRIHIVATSELPPKPPNGEGGADFVTPPEKYALEPAYPNPFNPSTVIRYRIAMTGHVNLKVYDVLGRGIATLVDEVKPPGEYTVRWDASNQPGGVYIYRLRAGSYSASNKTILVR